MYADILAHQVNNQFWIIFKYVLRSIKCYLVESFTSWLYNLLMLNTIHSRQPWEEMYRELEHTIYFVTNGDLTIECNTFTPQIKGIPEDIFAMHTSTQGGCTFEMYTGKVIYTFKTAVGSCITLCLLRMKLLVGISMKNTTNWRRNCHKKAFWYLAILYTRYKCNWRWELVL